MKHLSYWDRQTWFNDIDFAIVGSGIVGLQTAIQLKKSQPNAKILVLERGTLPHGASTKNAGFACFGSVSELLSDLERHTETEVLDLVEARWEGLRLLRQELDGQSFGYEALGGYEVFRTEDASSVQTCFDAIPELNHKLSSIFDGPVFQIKATNSSFSGFYEHTIFNRFEGQLNAGDMIQALLSKAHSLGILILNGLKVTHFSSTFEGVVIDLDGLEVKCKRLAICTNGFASELLEEDVQPARNQVLMTTPITGLQIQGSYHLDQGYFYFRNVGNRILLGGGRHLDMTGETTFDMNQTPEIQTHLEGLLRNHILPNVSFEIEHRWSGILGIGSQKKPIVKELQPNVYCGIRMGGMGVAIGSLVGHQLSKLMTEP